MTTKAPSAVKPAEEGSLEKIAYASVSAIPAADPHDRDRLGYNVWRWLSTRRDSLEFSVRTAGVRLGVSEEEAVRTIRESLRAQGVKL
ncbi:MAG TPA: hypothetical protein VK569_11175 [Bacteroidota bacterium]|nr:hypothetical protein [Bacteroidota bacterium]